MKYYRYLDLDFLDVSEKLKTYTINNKDKIQGFWTYLDTPKMLYLFPEIQKMFDPLNIKIKRLSLITATVSSIKNGIHRDHTDCNVRINIPILNCFGSITNFYKSDAEPTKLLLPNGVPYYQLDSNKCTLADSFCLDKPAAIRVTEPHQVIVGAHVPRISCTVEFEENIDYLLDN